MRRPAARSCISRIARWNHSRWTAKLCTSPPSLRYGAVFAPVASKQSGDGRDALIPKYAELVYNGFWYAPERYALQAYVEESQKNVTGTVRVKLYKGNIMVAGRKSPVSLYNPHIATMEADPTKAYNQDDATGFIRLNGLRLKVAAKVHKKK